MAKEKMEIDFFDPGMNLTYPEDLELAILVTNGESGQLEVVHNVYNAEYINPNCTTPNAWVDADGNSYTTENHSGTGFVHGIMPETEFLVWMRLADAKGKEMEYHVVSAYDLG